MILATLTGYAIYTLSRDSRLAHYQQDALGGMMRLIADSAARQEESDRLRYYDIVAQLLSAEVSQLTLSSNQFSGATKNALLAGIPQQRSADVSRVDWYLPFDETSALALSIQALSEQQFRAYALLFVTELRRRDAPLSLSRLQDYSNYPLVIADIASLQLDSQQKSRLQRNSVVVNYASEPLGEFTVYAPLSAEQVVVLGPIKQFDDLPRNIVLFIGLMAMLIVALVSYFLVYRLAKRLNVIADTLEQFKEGELSARASLQGKDEFSAFAASINAMATQIESLLQSQREIMQAVSHELRTPISRIRFRLETLRETGDQRLDRNISGVSSDISEIEQLIDEILEHHQMLNAPQFETQQLNLEKLVKDVWANLKDLHPEIAFELDCPSRQLITANQKSLYRLLQNLMGNAGTYAHTRIAVAVYIDEDQLCIAVEDDGPGIPSPEREKVFTAFYRVDDSRNKGSGGYGLGLAICSSILKLHGASAEVQESSLGGSRFLCKFPLTTPEENPA